MSRNRRLAKIKTFKVGIYLRLSVEDGGHKKESESISNQRMLALDFLKHHEDMVLIKEYVDDGETGYLFDRPGFQEMLEDAKNEVINCIVVKDQSRFGRNQTDVEVLIKKRFKEYNVRFIAILDQYDTLTSGYDMMFSVRNMFNEHYAQDISAKCQASFKAKQRNGEFVGAFASYGYCKSENDRHKLEIDPYAAEVVRRIFDMFLSGYGKVRIAKILNEEGILCPSAYKRQNGYNYTNSNKLDTTFYWTYSTINKILKNEMYTGTMVQGTTWREIHGKPERLDESEWIKVSGTHEAIIDRDTWEKTQAALKQRKTDLTFEHNQSFFAGFLKCGDCGRAMRKTSHKNSRGQTYFTFKCGTYQNIGKKGCTSHYIKEDTLKAIVLHDLNQMISAMQHLKELVERAEKEAKKKMTSTEMYLMDIEKTKKEIDRRKNLKKKVFEEYAEGNLSNEEYIEYREIYAKEEDELHQKLCDLEKKVQQNKQSDVLDLPWVQHLLEHKEITELTREIVVEMIDEIQIFENKRIKIRYNFSNEYENLMKLVG